MMLREAAQQALEALEQWNKPGYRLRNKRAAAAVRAALAEPVKDTRVCTCHPDDNPPKPCPKKYALGECREAALAKPEKCSRRKICEREVDGYCARCHEEMYP